MKGERDTKHHGNLPGPSKGWCLNPKGLLSGTPYHPFGTPWRVQVWYHGGIHNNLILLMATWNPVNSPVEVGSLSHDSQGFIHPMWVAGFLPSTVKPAISWGRKWHWGGWWAPEIPTKKTYGYPCHRFFWGLVTFRFLWIQEPCALSRWVCETLDRWNKIL